jgi:hypothetical protein
LTPRSLAKSDEASGTKQQFMKAMFLGQCAAASPQPTKKIGKFGRLLANLRLFVRCNIAMLGPF